MKYIAFLSLVLVVAIFGCKSNIQSANPVNTDSVTKPDSSAKTNPGPTTMSDNPKDKKEILTLIRQMLKWADSKNGVELVPALSRDSICTGIDLDKLNQNIEKLKSTGFFAGEFIDNYKRILVTLDKKIRNNEFEKWNVYELPTFSFANDVDPWCSCQDNLSWDDVEVEIINLNNDQGELKWDWKTDTNTDKSWKDFAYKFSVLKVDGKWKISYLQGFDYDDSIKRDGF